MFEAEKHRRTLNEVSWNNKFIWPQEFASAAKWALTEIERLTTENAEFKNQLGDERQRVADFAILFEQAKLE